MKSLGRWTFLACAAFGAGTYVASLGCAGNSNTARVERGRQIYLASCAMCHGNAGAGDGPLAVELASQGGAQPAPLSSAERIQALGRDGVRRIIVSGGGGMHRSNLMPPWVDKLDAQQIDDVTDYVMTLPSRDPGTPAATTDKYLQAPAGVPDAGRVTYVQFCSSCHGPEGKGDGPFARSIKEKYKILPRNLTQSAYFEKKTDQELFSVISLGGGHYGRSTMMPAWTVRLHPDQIKNLVAYIRAISGTPSRP